MAEHNHWDITALQPAEQCPRCDEHRIRSAAAALIDETYLYWLQKDDTAPLSALLLQALKHNGYVIVRG